MNDQPDVRLEPVFRAQLYLIDGLWVEVRELLGPNQAASFGTEILASIPKIQSLKELLAAIAIALQPDKSLEAYSLSPQQLSTLHKEIQRLGGKYIGKNYTKELLGDLLQALPPQLKRDLQVWLQK